MPRIAMGSPEADSFSSDNLGDAGIGTHRGTTETLWSARPTHDCGFSIDPQRVRSEPRAM